VRVPTFGARRSEMDPIAHPIARRLIGSAAATVDRAVVAALQMANRKVRRGPEALSHGDRLSRLAMIRDAYCTPALIGDPDAYFRAPPDPATLAVRERLVRPLAWGGDCVELSWASAFEPFHESVRDAYLVHAENRTAHARLYGKGWGRPAVILVHGYMAGQWSVEERVWPIRWMNKHGLDVALFLLPFHGVRATREGGPTPFPGADPRFTNEGFRQAVADLRVLAGLLEARGAPAIGIMGMSLGGYTTALMATLQRDLAFVVPIIPLSSVADFARDQGRLGKGERAAMQHEALEAANRVVSPLARPSLVARDRILVIGAEADQVTPIRHAERLAAHFDVPLLRLPGGHLLQAWRAPAFRAVKALLRTHGLIPGRGADRG
jgi:pimeloyl-ACP methyl ester carboxylesterase